jgi:hypothetical protein
MRCGFSVEHNHYRLWECGTEAFGPLGEWTHKKDIPEEYKDVEWHGNHDGNTFYEGKVYFTHTTTVEPLENCLFLVRRTIEGILQAVGTTQYRIFIKGEGNFREQVAKTRPYKGNRDKQHRPVYEKEIREYLIKYWKAEVVNGQEVDDKIAQVQQGELFTHSGELVYDPDTIICSPDKDFLQIPGYHLNTTTNEEFWVTEDEAMRFLWKQILTGDQSDNIQGVPGIGPKKADKLLEKCETEHDMYKVVLAEYKKAYGDKADEVLDEMANLIMLRRREGVPWTPPVEEFEEVKDGTN